MTLFDIYKEEEKGFHKNDGPNFLAALAAQ